MSKDNGSVELAGIVTGRWTDMAGNPNRDDDCFIRVSRTEMQVSGKIYHRTREGDRVILKVIQGSKDLLGLRNGTSSTAKPLSVLEDETFLKWAKDVCDTLENRGVNARVLEQSRSSDTLNAMYKEPRGWVEIAAGPVRWVETSTDLKAICHVPDPRIRWDFPEVFIT